MFFAENEFEGRVQKDHLGGAEEGRYASNH